MHISSVHITIYWLHKGHSTSSVCETEWKVSSNTGTTGGEFVGAQSLEDCRDLCLANPECVAVDVSLEAPFLCFLHTNQSLGDGDNYTSPFISQDMVVNRCFNGKYLNMINTLGHLLAICHRYTLYLSSV